MPEWTIGRHRGGCCLVYYRDGKRHRHALGTSDALEAGRRAPAVYHELTRTRGTTIAALWEAYCADKDGRAIIPTMRHTYKALAYRFGSMEARDLTVADCRAHVAARRGAGIKDGTIHTEMGHLRMVLVWAEKQSLIERAPYVERPAKPKPKERHLTHEEVGRLMSACDLPHVRLFVLLAYATAGRAAALLGLRWDRVDFDRGKLNLQDDTITTPHKGRAIVPMNNTLRAALLEAKAGALTPHVIEWAGKPVRSVKKGLATAAAKAGLRKVSPHMLRHSAAVRMAEARVPMEEIASYLGHSNINVTRTVYARFSPDSLRSAAKALELGEVVRVYQKGVA